MKKRNALTLVEVLVIIGVLVILLSIMTIVLQRPRGPHLTSYCLFNLKNLTLAWMMYADDNDGKIVNGAAGVERLNEPAWTGKDWTDDYRQGGILDPNDHIAAIKAGALWPYVKSIGAYRCSVMRERKRTYSIVDSMNGVPQPGNPMGRGPTEIIDKLIAKDRRQVRSPHTRAAFLCVGWVAPGSYGVYYDKEKWWDLPSVRHDNNWTIVCYADSHGQFWKWKGKETIELFKAADPTQLSEHFSPATHKGKEDLQMVQKAVWGELGYTPSTGE
jgi:hypothetical protein